jgi:hypothetical protein
MGLALGRGSTLHTAWGDTRGQNGTVEEDVHHASVPAAVP